MTNAASYKDGVRSMFKKDSVRGVRRRWAVAVAAVALTGVELAGAGAAVARPVPVVVRSGIHSANYTGTNGEAKIRNDINQQCKRIDARSTGGNFHYASAVISPPAPATAFADVVNH
ncbi:hypothetical protein [Streptomyces sp. UG1]|uniref:hypothetical protein n=1 Tax=Streptomyces sp. UG1 TaxID=3417652 RepID=UPI003CED7C99